MTGISSMPNDDEVTRLTNVIVEGLGEADIDTALMVVCNIAGQLVCELSYGKPSLVQLHGNEVAENVKKAAIAKLWHDDTQRRKVETDAPE